MSGVKAAIRQLKLMSSPVVVNDVNDSLAESLRGHLGSKTANLRGLLEEFHNVLLKHIVERPRDVHVSEELSRHKLFLHDKRAVIEQIIASLKQGDSLARYLSDKSDQLRFVDQSLAYFGVHHLHLGEKMGKCGARTGRVKGTGSLLFIRVTDNDAYLLDILGHGKVDGFLNMRLVRIMYENWPESIEEFHVKGVTGVAVKYSDEEAAKLLDHDVNVSVELGEGQVYMLPGMGMTAAGTPFIMERRVVSTLDKLENIAVVVKNNAAEVSAAIQQITGVGHNVIRLKGRVRDGLLDVYDASSGCVVNMHQQGLVVSAPKE